MGHIPRRRLLCYECNRYTLLRPYFCLKNICTGTPVKSKFSRSLFSMNRWYGSLIYCGRLQKKANMGDVPFIWVIYLILTYLPLMDGGGKFSMIGNISS